jgi:hypothetical protein
MACPCPPCQASLARWPSVQARAAVSASASALVLAYHLTYQHQSRWIWQQVRRGFLIQQGNIPAAIAQGQGQKLLGHADMQTCRQAGMPAC